MTDPRLNDPTSDPVCKGRDLSHRIIDEVREGKVRGWLPVLVEINHSEADLLRAFVGSWARSRYGSFDGVLPSAMADGVPLNIVPGLVRAGRGRAKYVRWLKPH